jgi:hypothetical protein
MKLIISYFCSYTFKDKEIVVENATHIPRIGETVKCEAIVNRSGNVYWPKLEVADVVYDFKDGVVMVTLE